MDLSVIYSKTGKGMRALAGKSRGLPSNLMRALSLIDGKSTVRTILAQSDHFTEEELAAAFTRLEIEGYIKTVKTIDPDLLWQEQDTFSTMEVSEVSVEEFLKLKTESEAKVREEAEAQAKAETEATAAAERKAAQEAAAKAREEAEAIAAMERKALAEAEARAQAEAQRKAKEQAERRAQQEAQRKAREEAEARARAEAERKAKEDAAARAEAERRALAEAEARAQAEAERKAKEDAEARARAEAERQAQQAAERRAREEAAAKAREEAERRAREEAEAVAEAERKALAEAEARAQAEAERKAKEEAEARAEAERQAQQEAERRAREEAAAKAREEAERRAREEAEAVAEAERKALAEAEARAQAEAERKAKEEAEARAEAERQAQQEAERRARAEAEAKAKAERKAREKAEAKAREESERRVREEAKASAKAEAQRKAKEMAQARARAAAERKAEKQAKAERAREERLQAKAASMREKLESPPKPRKLPVHISKLVGIVTASTLTAALLLLVSLYFINLSAIIPVEKLASDKIHAPVTVGSMHVALLPTPHFVLQGVKVVSAPEITLGTLRVMPVLNTLLQDAKTLRGLEIDSMTVPPESLDKVLQWMEASRGVGKLRLSHITLSNARIAAQGLQLPPFDAEIMLDASDQVEGATLKSTDGRLSAQLTPHGDRLEASITAAAWRPPIGAALVFDELNVQAVASRKGMRIIEMSGRIFSGTISGNAAVGWDGPWTAAGKFTLSDASLLGLSQAFAADIALTGDVDMKASYSAKSNHLRGLLDQPAIKAAFTCRDGSIGSVNLARTVVQDTRSSGENLTRFDRLSGSMEVADGRYQFRQLKLSGRQLSASGDIALAANKNLSGSINAEMAVPSRRFHAKLRLSGNLKQPRLK